MNQSLNRSIDYTYNNNTGTREIADIYYAEDKNMNPAYNSTNPKHLSNIDKDRRNWQSQQIAGILTIIFFGIIAIAYILFVNAFLMKDTDKINNLIELPSFNNTLLVFCILSFLIIIFVVSATENNVFVVSSCSSIVLLLSFALVLSIMGFDIKQAISAIINSDLFKQILSIIDDFFGYTSQKQKNEMNIFQQIINYSLFAPFLIILFVFLTITTSEKILYLSLSIAFAFEYAIKGRWMDLHFFDNTLPNIPMMIRLAAFVFYLSIPVIFFLLYYGKI